MTIPPSLPRDPTLSDRHDPRTRRFLDMFAAVFNSLTADDILIIIGPGQWSMNTASDQFVLANRVFSPKATYGMFGG